MNLEIPPLKRLLLLLFVVVPIAAWVIVKPMRVVFPTLQGMTCVSETVCVEDPGTAASAIVLYDEALAWVSQGSTTLRGQPRLVFCSTDACANKFGLKDRAALTVGKFGTIIGPRAWEAYLVRHEMIHFVQCERLGVLKVIRMPSWFVEGMAYSWSKDPRNPLPEPFEAYRSQFNEWSEGVDGPILWRKARRL